MVYFEHEPDASDVAATLAATNASPMPRIEIVEERRRSHDAGFRARVLAAASAPGARVEEVVGRYRICTSLIYRERRAASGPPLSAPTVKLVSVRVAERREIEPSAVAVRPEPQPKRPCQIEVEFYDGDHTAMHGYPDQTRIAATP